ncbi:MAG: hypothetical protein ACKOE6_11320 [Flammeovirgaceae bacterium]
MKSTIQLRMVAFFALAIFFVSFISSIGVSAGDDDFSYKELSINAAVSPSATPAEEKEGGEKNVAAPRVTESGALIYTICKSCVSTKVWDRASRFTYVTYCIGQSLYLAHRSVRI